MLHHKSQAERSRHAEPAVRPEGARVGQHFGWANRSTTSRLKSAGATLQRTSAWQPCSIMAGRSNAGDWHLNILIAPNSAGRSMRAGLSLGLLVHRP